jgi:hypothetical protein
MIFSPGRGSGAGNLKDFDPYALASMLRLLLNGK